MKNGTVVQVSDAALNKARKEYDTQVSSIGTVVSYSYELTTVQHDNGIKVDWHSKSLKPLTKEEQLYHVARTAFNCGTTTPWHLMVHAIRESLNMPVEFVITDQHKTDFPDLVQFQSVLKRLKDATS